jgi:hypothetical protein
LDRRLAEPQGEELALALALALANQAAGRTIQPDDRPTFPAIVVINADL